MIGPRNLIDQKLARFSEVYPEYAAVIHGMLSNPFFSYNERLHQVMAYLHELTKAIAQSVMNTALRQPQATLFTLPRDVLLSHLIRYLSREDAMHFCSSTRYLLPLRSHAVIRGLPFQFSDCTLKLPHRNRVIPVSDHWFRGYHLTPLPNGKLICSYGVTFSIIDLLAPRGEECLATVKMHEDENDVNLHFYEKLLSETRLATVQEHAITIWDISNLRQPVKIREIGGFDADTFDMQPIDANRFATVVGDRLNLFDIRRPQGQELAAMMTLDENVNVVGNETFLVFDEHIIVTVTRTGTLQVWDINKPENEMGIFRHTPTNEQDLITRGHLLKLSGNQFVLYNPSLFTVYSLDPALTLTPFIGTTFHPEDDQDHVTHVLAMPEDGFVFATAKNHVFYYSTRDPSRQKFYRISREEAVPPPSLGKLLCLNNTRVAAVYLDAIRFYDISGSQHELLSPSNMYYPLENLKMNAVVTSHGELVMGADYDNKLYTIAFSTVAYRDRLVEQSVPVSPEQHPLSPVTELRLAIHQHYNQQHPLFRLYNLNTMLQCVIPFLGRQDAAQLRRVCTQFRTAMADFTLSTLPMASRDYSKRLPGLAYRKELHALSHDLETMMFTMAYGKTALVRMIDGVFVINFYHVVDERRITRLGEIKLAVSRIIQCAALNNDRIIVATPEGLYDIRVNDAGLPFNIQLPLKKQVNNLVEMPDGKLGFIMTHRKECVFATMDSQCNIKKYRLPFLRRWLQSISLSLREDGTLLALIVYRNQFTHQKIIEQDVINFRLDEKNNKVTDVWLEWIMDGEENVLRTKARLIRPFGKRGFFLACSTGIVYVQGSDAVTPQNRLKFDEKRKVYIRPLVRHCAFLTNDHRPVVDILMLDSQRFAVLTERGTLSINRIHGQEGPDVEFVHGVTSQFYAQVLQGRLMKLENGNLLVYRSNGSVELLKFARSSMVNEPRPWGELCQHSLFPPVQARTGALVQSQTRLHKRKKEASETDVDVKPLRPPRQ